MRTVDQAVEVAIEALCNRAGLELSEGVRGVKETLQANGYVIVPREPTAAMISASIPAFAEVEGAIQHAWVHGFELTAKHDDPPIKQAWRAMIKSVVS